MDSLTVYHLANLIDIFARLSHNGRWEIPQWLCDMQRDLGLPVMQSFYVIDWSDYGL